MGRRTMAYRSKVKSQSAPRIVNAVWYVTKINHDNHFSWETQYLVMLEGNLCCAAHSKFVSRINDESTPCELEA